MFTARKLTSVIWILTLGFISRYQWGKCMTSYYALMNAAAVSMTLAANCCTEHILHKRSNLRSRDQKNVSFFSFLLWSSIKNSVSVRYKLRICNIALLVTLHFFQNVARYFIQTTRKSSDYCSFVIWLFPTTDPTISHQGQDSSSLGKNIILGLWLKSHT